MSAQESADRIVAQVLPQLDSIVAPEMVRAVVLFGQAVQKLHISALTGNETGGSYNDKLNDAWDEAEATLDTDEDKAIFAVVAGSVALRVVKAIDDYVAEVMAE